MVTEQLTIELGRQTVTAPYTDGDTVLQTARMAGLNAPSSCEIGSCGTCMARVTEGSVRMLNNDALEDEELDDGALRPAIRAVCSTVSPSVYGAVTVCLPSSMVSCSVTTSSSGRGPPAHCVVDEVESFIPARVSTTCH